MYIKYNFEIYNYINNRLLDVIKLQNIVIYKKLIVLWNLVNGLQFVNVSYIIHTTHYNRNYIFDCMCLYIVYIHIFTNTY